MRQADVTSEGCPGARVGGWHRWCGATVRAIVPPIPVRHLIVDDDASFREEICALLAEQGLDVVGGAGSAAEGLRQIAELQPDVALIDIDLGDESGLELRPPVVRGAEGCRRPRA